MDYRKLIDRYEARVRKLATPKRGDAGPFDGWDQAWPHVLWMLGEMRTLLDEYTPPTPEQFYKWLEVVEPKLNRWLGFVQGLLWAGGLYTIDELREHVIDAKG